MSDVTRYDCTIGPEGTPEMDPFSHGDWVSFDDYEKLEAAIDMLEKQRASTDKLIAKLEQDREEKESMLFAAYNNSGSGMSYFNWEHNLKEV